jgi:HK97 family phage prohead protease
VPASKPLPRDDLFRALPEPIGLTRADGAAMPTLTGFFSVFDEWTEINSMWEGHFMERFSPGAFSKTMKENRDGMRVLFQHGQDPQIGDKVLGPISALREEPRGAYYEAPLLDTAYNRELLPGLEAGLYGASFRFRVMREEIIDKPEASKTNPRGLPERTVKEAMVREFGPVTFPAYAGATAGVRSLTDEFLLRRFLDDPDRLREVLDQLPAGHAVAERMDTEDLMPLNQMMMCATDYIGAQDPESEQPQIDQMESVIAILHDLQTIEVNEDEAMEPPDPGEGMNAATPDEHETHRGNSTAPSPGGADRTGHPALLRRASRTTLDTHSLTRKERPKWQL